VSASASQLVTGESVPFGKIAAALARGSCADAGAMRTLVATVVAVGPADRLETAAEVLETIGDAGTVRGILISEGDSPAPSARVAGHTVALHGLKPAYVNNAVAALRLSSLPTLVWWRGGRPETLDGLADLADRIVLDEDSPEPVWQRAATLFDLSAFSDLRWARLTQWRALMAQFFDIPEVRAGASRFTRLHIRAADHLSGRLFAAWLTSSIRFSGDFSVEIAEGRAPIEMIRLGDHEQELTLQLAGEHACLETEVCVRGHRSCRRMVSLRDLDRARLLTDELRIRSRDMAFERALRMLLTDAPEFSGRIPGPRRPADTSALG
jgi:glucose-6-phosphate dehydrogenase assembly protein OpcA